MRNPLEPDAARLEKLLQRLSHEKAPLALRQEVAEALADAVKRMPLAPGWFEAFQKLAVDEAPEVRRAVARALPDLPDEPFVLLTARLADDRNQYVRDAVAKANERRGKGLQQSRKSRKNATDFHARYQAFESAYGARAARQARRVANEMFDALIGGTLHDMNGILASMRADLDLMRRHFENGKPGAASCRTKVTKFSQQVEFLQAFLNDMRTYAKAEEGKRVRGSVSDIVQKALTLAQEGLQAAGLDMEAVVVDMDVPETLRACLSHRHAITALMNLIRNGLESLALATIAGEKRLAVRARSDNNNGVRITVEDNGPGIASDTLQELLLFTPGKTTKKNGGTGFGLPTAHRFAEAHGGRLDIDSQPGVATVFTLILPALDEEMDE
jgi:signal transduction histidine kinase